MSNLEKSIAKWREQMILAGIRSLDHLDELEAHLREDIEQQLRAGVSEPRAFEIAVEHIGQAAALRKEFIKAGILGASLLAKLKAIVLGPPDRSLPALDHFELAAKQTLKLAPEEARQFNHNFVGTEHLLLGLIRSESKTMTNVMEKLGVKHDLLRSEIERFVGLGAVAVTATHLPYTPRAQAALKLAAKEARTISHQSGLKAEHILLGLLREGSGVAALVLKKLGVNLEQARAVVLKELNTHSGAN